MAFHRGSEGRHRTDVELARQKERAEQRKKQSSQPFRFYVPVGETRQVIICDDAPDFFTYEHNLPGPDKKWRTYSGCIKEDANCPVCDTAERESYYAMFLTVVDLTPFETRDGKEVEFSRKLLCVKPGQQKKFLRFYEREGTLRGAMFDMTRDGEKDASIGNDIEFVEFVPEDEMETYVRSWKDKEGKKHTEVCHEAFVYEDLFEEPTEENLRALVGGRPSPGSRAADDEALGRGKSRRGGADRAPARGASRGKAKADDDWESDDDQREYGDDKKPARTTGKRKAEPEDDDAPAKPARRSRDDTQRVTRRSRAEEPEDVDADADDDAPAPRGTRTERTSARTPAKSNTPKRGRAEPEDTDADDPPFDPDPPKRGRGRAEPEEPPARGRARREEPEDADADDAPARGASRRASMRGRR